MTYRGSVSRHHPYRSAGAAIDFAAIRAELRILDGFPAEVAAEAEHAAKQGPAVWVPSYSDRGDDRDIALVTIDPAGAMDLDQAVALERRDDGFRVYYAIADVGAFVEPGGAMDTESHRRGMTLYSPDTRTLLYPAVLSEGTASLLPGQDRPALLWTIDLDEAGEPTAVDLRRTTVRSRARLDYDEVQADANIGALHPSIALLPHIGALRLQSARRRHAIDLDLPDAEIVPAPGARWTLSRRALLPVERYNAQISLLTGMCAAQIMLRGGMGILRTLPPPTAEQIATLRRTTVAFGIPWPDGVPPGDIVSELSADVPRQAAFIEDAIRLLRGADYTSFDGERPAQQEHGGLGAPYAHATAPLRRLVDRYGLEVCLALVRGAAPLDDVRHALPELPSEMRSAAGLSSQLDNACASAVSDFLLTSRVGQVLTGIVVQIDRRRERATVLLDDPPVRVAAPADGFVEGARMAVRLGPVDTGTGRVTVELVR